METTLYTVTIPPMMKVLEAQMHMLDKVSEHVAKFANQYRDASYYESRLLQAHLIFDQFPFIMQVQRVSDNAKGGAARLAGIEAPEMKDEEKTVAELKVRLQKTLDFLKTIKPEQVNANESIKVSLPYWGGKHLTGFEYAMQYLMPNFYFHAVSAYSILRANGVQIGKGDYIMNLPLKD